MKKGLSLSQKYKTAKDQHDNLIKWKNIASFSFLKVGKFLKKIKEENLYKYLGTDSPEYETFDNYLRMPEINIDLRKAYYLIQIYSTFVLKYGYKMEELSGIYWTALRSILPCVNSHNVKDLVEKARILTRSHLDIEMKQLKQGLETLEDLEKHKHTWKFISYYRCNVCGEKSMAKPKDGKIL